MKRNENLDTGHRKSSHKLWYIVGGTVLALVVFGVSTSLHDIRRYWNMTRM